MYLLLILRNFLGFNRHFILKMDSDARDGSIGQDHEHRDTSVPEHGLLLFAQNLPLLTYTAPTAVSVLSNTVRSSQLDSPYAK